MNKKNFTLYAFMLTFGIACGDGSVENSEEIAFTPPEGDNPHKDDLGDNPHKDDLDDNSHKDDLEDNPHKDDLDDNPHKDDLEDNPHKDDLDDNPHKDDLEDNVSKNVSIHETNIETPDFNVKDEVLSVYFNTEFYRNGKIEKVSEDEEEKIYHSI